jgi:energy-coupling factor transport system permease protein
MDNQKTGNNAFAAYHPFVNFSYFCFVLLFTMFFLQPLCLTISLVCAFGYAALLKGRKRTKLQLAYLIPLLLLCALINPIFNHQGLTVLAHLPNNNPLTLEATLYGLAAATMLAAVICWFISYNAVMTSDKFIYLFGRIIPGLSLILTMALRFVPHFARQAKTIANTQRCLGRDLSSGPLGQRMRLGAKITSILITWALENAIETADSMKSRGYGLPGRTSFALFTWESRDKKALASIFICGSYVLFGAIRGALSYNYFPLLQPIVPSLFGASVMFAYFLLCATPLFIETQEARKWGKNKENVLVLRFF